MAINTNATFLRGLWAAAVVIGAYYAAVALGVLVDLSAVTHQWVLASRDPDFAADFQQFRLIGGSLAVLAAALGLATMLLAIGRFFGRGRVAGLWFALTMLSIVVQAFRLLAQHIDGTLSGQLALRLVAISLLYGTLWRCDRRPSSEPTSAG